MGMTLMADDVSRLLGKLEQGFADVTRRLDLQDARTETNKQEAIQKREEKEARDEARFKVLDEKSTLTGGRVSVLEKRMDDDVQPVVLWHRSEGSKLGGRVSILEQKQVADATDKARADKVRVLQEGERRGFLRTWGLLGSLLIALAGIVGWLGADRLSAALFRLSVILGGGHG